MKRAWITTAALLWLGACGEGMDHGATARGMVVRGAAKADGSNSCADRCGGQAPAGCWCDAACDLHGDCCADKGASCDGQPGSCEGQCGGQSAAGCWCDAMCALRGDCCADKEARCGASCATATDCGSCLRLEGCNWSGGTCADSCLQAASCFGPQSPESPSCPELKCPALHCGMDCEHGYKRRSDGCPICACDQPPQ